MNSRVLHPSDSVAGKSPHIEIMSTKAEAVMETLAIDLEAWLEDDLICLDQAFVTACKADFDIETSLALHRAAHNLVGMAETYGYPEIGKTAAALCTLLGGDTARTDAVQIEHLITVCRAACS